MIKLEKCPVCKSNDWESLDHLRNQEYWYNADYRDEGEPVGFKICKECAFVTYDYLPEERLKESYERERPIMQYQNIITCNRKNLYHDIFLDDILP